MTRSMVDALLELCSPCLKGGNSAFIAAIASGLFPQTYKLIYIAFVEEPLSETLNNLILPITPTKQAAATRFLPLVHSHSTQICVLPTQGHSPPEPMTLDSVDTQRSMDVMTTMDGTITPGQRHMSPPQGHSPQNHMHSPQGHAHSSQGHAHPSQGQVHSPQEHMNSPQGHMNSPQGQSQSPQGHMHSPQGQMHSPRGRLHSPQGQLGHLHSPHAQAHPSHVHMRPSHVHVHPAQGQLHSSEGRMPSPQFTRHTREMAFAFNQRFRPPLQPSIGKDDRLFTDVFEDPAAWQIMNCGTGPVTHWLLTDLPITTD